LYSQSEVVDVQLSIYSAVLFTVETSNKGIFMQFLQDKTQVRRTTFANLHFGDLCC